MKHNIKRNILFFLLASAASVYSQEWETSLKGTPISSPSVDYGSGPCLAEYAFDNNPDTYYASQDRSHTWVGLDLGTSHVITGVGWMSRKGQASRVQLGIFEGSNREDFLDAVPLFIIPGAGEDAKWFTAEVAVTRAFRYVRYVGPSDVRCNIAEVAFWGEEGEGKDSIFYQLTDVPTVSIHTYNGNEPMDKVTDLEANITITYNNGTLIQEYPILTRGRGNASWTFPKKPYRIKFNDDKKHHMLKDSPMESPAKAKKWTLINNHGDKTLMRNLVAFEISRRLNLPYTVYAQPVDVILNGEYKGCYQLSDQITTDKARVPITDMEPTDEQEPELTGGYLLEIDAYADAEKSKFTSKHNIPVTIKSPDEDDITQTQHNYIKSYFESMEDLLWSDNYTDPVNGYRKKLDVTSFLQYFLLGELSGNTDTFWSVYTYKERSSDKFFISPGWDFDLAFDNDSRTYPINNNTNWICLTQGSVAGNMRQFVQRILADKDAEKEMRTIWANARKSGRICADSLKHYVDSMARFMEGSANLNFTRWPILNERIHMNPVARGSFEAEVKALSDYVTERIEWMDDLLGYGGGSIYVDSTYYISTPAELAEFAYAVNRGANGSTGYLTKDIDMAGTEMEIIGSRKPFKGTLDGQGHTISNLHIEGGNNCGLIGTVNDGATLLNLVVDSSCTIQGSDYVGIIGVSSGGGTVTIRNVGNEATITGGRNVGGIIGCNMGSAMNFIIENCYNAGTINGTQESGAISGWVGNDYTIRRCWNTGTVHGADGGREMFRYGNYRSDAYVVTTVGSQGVRVPEEAAASGELCYKANEESSEDVTWYQRLGKDPHPVFDYVHGIVYKEEDGTYSNGHFLLGDANCDGEVNAADIEMTAHYILGRDTQGFDFTNADVNGDSEINIIDMIQMASLEKGGEIIPTTEAPTPANLTSANASVTPGVTKRYSVIVKSSQLQTILQADIYLPAGLGLKASETSKGACLTTDHKVEVEATDDGYRVITYAPTMKNFTSNNSTVFTLKLIADDTFEGGTITIANQLIATAGNEVSRPEDVSYTIEFIPPTGVTDVEEDKQGSQQYNLDGTPINQLQRGKIYIVNNKKVLVK